MNAICFRTSAIVLLSTVLGAAFAQEPSTLPAVTARAVLQVIDCENRVLPSQREVGEWTGQHNFSQVYATRQRLMGDVARACHKPGIGQVLLVQVRQPARDQAAVRWVASIETSR